MWANTVWGLLGFGAALLLAQMSLPPEYQYLVEPFRFAAGLCIFFAAIILAWPFVRKRLSEKHIIRNSLPIQGLDAPFTTASEWSIKRLFFYIRHDLIDDPNQNLSQDIGKDVIDKLSTGKLRVWGRLVENSKRYALAEIASSEWQRASFTYWFLASDEIAEQVQAHCKSVRAGTADRAYADLRVDAAQAVKLWPHAVAPLDVTALSEEATGEAGSSQLFSLVGVPALMRAPRLESKSSRG